MARKKKRRGSGRDSSQTTRPNLEKRAALAFLGGIVLGLILVRAPMLSTGLATAPEALGARGLWLLAWLPFRSLGYGAYLLSLLLVVYGVVIARRTRRDKRRRLLYRGLSLLLFAAAWLGPLGAVVGGSPAWGGAVGELMLAAFQGVLGATFGPTVGVGILAIVLLEVCGVRLPWTALGQRVGSSLGRLFSKLRAERTAPPETPDAPAPEPGSDDVPLARDIRERAACQLVDLGVGLLHADRELAEPEHRALNALTAAIADALALSAPVRLRVEAHQHQTETAEDAPGDAVDALSTLSAAERERVAAAFVELARADGYPTRGERRALEDCCAILRMPEPYAKQALFMTETDVAESEDRAQDTARAVAMLLGVAQDEPEEENP